MSFSGTPSLDHLLVFAAVVDAGSFSGAANNLGRTQPMVSYAIGVLETQLGITLFERGRRRPVLTDAGAAILPYARRMALINDALRAGAASLISGLEGSVTIAVDSFFPADQLAVALREFLDVHSSVIPQIVVESRDGVLDHVVAGRCVFGIAATDIAWPAGIEARDFGMLTIVAVAAPDHVLARHAGDLPISLVREHVQITNKQPGTANEGLDVAINSARLLRINDLSAAVALLCAGVGWGYLPLHVVEEELDAGRLVPLALSTRARGTQPFALIQRADTPLGPGGRWLAARLLRSGMNY